jgi:hypothetical protein
MVKKNKRHNNNNTRVHVAFKAIIEPSYTPDTGTGGGGFQSIPINVALTDLTKDLGAIYKLYRFVDLKFEFQADPNPSTTLATGKPAYICMNYIPAKEQPITAWPNPLDLEKFEGPAVGFYGANRGHPYMYKVPKSILLSMPYNWYETKQNTPQFSDFTQGQFFIKTTDAGYYNPILAHITVEFQTMEDPEFLTSNLRLNQTIDLGKPKFSRQVTIGQVVDIEDSDKGSIYKESEGGVFVGRTTMDRKYCPQQRL